MYVFQTTSSIKFSSYCIRQRLFCTIRDIFPVPSRTFYRNSSKSRMRVVSYSLFPETRKKDVRERCQILRFQFFFRTVRTNKLQHSPDLADYRTLFFSFVLRPWPWAILYERIIIIFLITRQRTRVIIRFVSGRYRQVKFGGRPIHDRIQREYLASIRKYNFQKKKKKLRKRNYRNNIVEYVRDKIIISNT